MKQFAETKIQKDFDGWNMRKKSLDCYKKKIYFRKSEIWWCALGVNIGFEQDGKNENFERPVLVLRKINRHLAFIIPLSSKIKNHPYYYRYDYDGKYFSAILFQSRVVSTKRFLRRLGVMEKINFYGIIEALIRFIKDN